MNDQLLARVRHLQADRERLAHLKLSLLEKESAFQRANSLLLADIEVAKREVVAGELTVRTLAIDHFTATNEKEPAPGITVKASSVYAVDEAAAFTWAQKTEMCLIPARVDLDAVKAIASKTPLPFVTKSVEHTASIAKDLRKALESVPASAPESTPAVEQPEPATGAATTHTEVLPANEPVSAVLSIADKPLPF